MKNKLIISLITISILCSQFLTNVSVAATKKYDYVVITTDYIEENSKNLGSFLNEKKRMGYKPLVVTPKTSHIKGGWGGGTGNNASEKIRKWLKKYYKSLGIKYVLLVGNPDSKKGDVPMKSVHAMRKKKTDGTMKIRVVDTDMYYAELNDNWDSNKDGYYGVYPQEMHTDVDLIVGRIPVYSNNITNLDKILKRSTDYTKIGDVAYKKNVLIATEPMSDSYKNTKIGEALKKDILDPKKFKTYRIYDDKKPTPDKHPTNLKNVKSSWQSFNPGLVVWSGHGSATSTTDIMNSKNTEYLADKTPEFVFSSSCHNGKPSKSNNLGYSLLLNSSVGVLSSTAMTCWSSGENFKGSRTSNGVAYNFVKNFVKNMSIGEAYSQLIDSKELAEIEWRNLLEYNIYGDPSLKLKLPHRMIKDSKIYNKWLKMNSNKGVLGYTITNTATTPNKLGVYNHFEKGSIYRKKTAKEAFAVYGLNRAKWAKLGWEKSFLGFPTTDELSTYNNTGRFNHFDGGSIYYKNGKKESFEVHGNIRALWSWFGWETSQLGFPTTDEYGGIKGKNANSIYRASRFDNGIMYYEGNKSYTYTWPVMWKAKKGDSSRKQKITQVHATTGKYLGILKAARFDVKGTGFPANKKITVYLSSVDKCYKINTGKTNNKGEFYIAGRCFISGVPTLNGIATIWIQAESGHAAIYSYVPKNVKTINTTKLR